MKLHLLVLTLVLGLVACSKDELAPATPTGLQATPADRAIGLKWTANSEPDLAGYVIGWRPSSGGASQSKTIPAPGTAVVLDGLSNETTYLLTLTAIDATGNKSAATAPVVASPKAAPVVNQAPAKPQGLTATAQNAQVSLNWTPNAESDLGGYTVFYGTSSNLDKTQIVDAPSSNTLISGLSNNTLYFFALEAQTSKGLKSPRSDPVNATPKAIPLAPTILDVSLSDYGLSNQVRQGAGTIEVAIKGSNLATLVRATLGTYSLKITSKQADGAKLEVSIPHGATLGDLNLTIENDVSSITRNAVLEVTKITTATKPEFNPSDTEGKGTPNRPFRTVSKALTVATKGDTVLLTAGIYQAGETWPMVGSGLESATNVADGVTVEGQSSDRGAVLLLGPGNTTDAGGLVLTNDAILRNLTLQGFARGVFRQSVYPELSGTIRLENMAIFQSAIGLNIVYAANLSIHNSLFSGNGLEGAGGAGIHLRGVGQVTLSGVTQSNNNQTGMTLDRASDVQAEGLEVKGNKLEGIRVQNSQLSLSSSQVIANSGVGILVNNSDAKSFSVAGCSIANNGSHGIDLMVSAGSISIGRSQLFGNAGWQLYDERSVNNPNPIYAFFSTFEGISLESQLSLTSGTGGADVMQSGKKLLRIDQPGNTIYFTL